MVHTLRCLSSRTSNRFPYRLASHFFAFLLLLWGSTQAAYAQPANDNPAGAVVLTPGSACTPTSGTNAAATTTTPSGYMNPATCGVAVSPKDVWYRFTAPAPAARITVTGTAAGLVRLFTSAAGAAGPFTEVDCADGGANNTSVGSFVTTALTVGTTYYVAVSGYGSNDTQGAFTICVATPSSCAAAVTGLAFNSATSTLSYNAVTGTPGYAVFLSDATGLVASGILTTTSISLASFVTAGTAYSATVYTLCANGGLAQPTTLSFTAGSTGSTCAPVTGASVGSITSTSATLSFTAATGAASYTVTLTSGTGTPASGTFTGTSISLTSLSPSTTYTVTIVTNCGGGMSSAVTVTFTTPPAGGTAAPANDNCAGAVMLTPSPTCTPVSGTVAGATQSLAPITCGGFTGTAPSQDVWYRFVATSSTHTITVAGTFDGVLDVRSGTCASTTNIGCADASGNNETLTLTTLTVGTTYYLRYYPYNPNPSSSTFTICVTGPAPSACPDPTNAGIGSVTNTTAQVVFTPGAGNTGYIVTYTPAGGATTTLTVNNTNSPISLTGLTPGTAYSLTLQSVCANGTGAILTGTFTTQTVAPPVNDDPAGALSLPVTATCVATAGTNAGATTTTPNGYANPSASPTTCGMAVSPRDVWYTFTAPNTAVGITVTGAPAGSVRVFSSAGGAAGPFTQVSCAAGPTNNTTAGSLTVTGLTTGATYYVAVAGYGSADAQGAFTICVTGAAPATCNPVTSLAAGSVTATTASVSFTPGSGNTSYTVTYTPAGGTTTTIAPAPTASPVALTGLMPATTYTVSVTPVCAAGGTATATTTTFTTSAAPVVCNPVTSLAVGGITATTAGVSFTPGSGNTSYTVTYTPAGGATTTLTPAPTASPVALTGLMPATTYTVSVTPVCAAGGTATATTTTFTTSAPTCNPVTSLAVGGITATTAGVSFTPGSGNTSYTVTYTPAGGATTTIAPAPTASPVALTGLTPTTTYTVSVTPVCAAGGTATATTTTFTTSAAPVVCNPVTSLAVGGITATTAGVSFTPGTGNTSYTVTYTPAGGATTTIAPAPTASPVALTGLTPATTYTVSVTPVCAAGGTATATTTTFTTSAAPVVCDPVTSLAVSAISATSASVGFTAPASGATSYSVAYTPAGGTTVTVAPAPTASPVVLSGLTPGTNYTVTVTTNCGGTQTSGMVTATFSTQPLAARSALEAQVQVFPNPARQYFNVRVPALTGAATMHLALYNSLGQLVGQQQVGLKATGTQAEVDVSQLATGVYTLHLRAGTETIIKRLTVMAH